MQSWVRARDLRVQPGLASLRHLCLEKLLGPQRLTFPFLWVLGIRPWPRPSIFHVALETKVQENKVRQVEFPFWKAPLPGFHYSHPAALGHGDKQLGTGLEGHLCPPDPPGLPGELGHVPCPVSFGLSPEPRLSRPLFLFTWEEGTCAPSWSLQHLRRPRAGPGPWLRGEGKQPCAGGSPGLRSRPAPPYEEPRIFGQHQVTSWASDSSSVRAGTKPELRWPGEAAPWPLVQRLAQEFAPST